MSLFHRLSGRNRKANLITLLLMNYLHLFGWALLAPLYAVYAIELGGSPQEVGLTFAAYHLLAGVLTIFLGWFEDRLGDRPQLLAVGYFLHTVGILMLYIATDQLGLLYGLAVYAVGLGLVLPLWKVVFSRYAHKDRQATEWGFMQGGSLLLMALAAMVSGLIYAAAGFKTLIVLAAVANVLSLLLALRIKR